jgi:hypothetical protein
MDHAVRFTDHRGLEWTVYEVETREITFDDRLVERVPRHLTFESSRGELRRLDAFPAGWHTASAVELEALAERAAAVRGAAAGGESGETRSHVEDLTT